MNFSFLFWYHNAVRKVFKGVHRNLSMRKDFASVVVLCLALAVCIVVIRFHQPAEEIIDERVAFGDVSDIVSITVDVVPENWDADPEKDGFMLYITFYDERDTIVAFKGTEYSIRIKIFKAEADSNRNTVKGELLYDLCCPPIKKTSSSEVCKPHGVKMFLTFSDDVEWVTVEVEVEIPGVGTFSDADEGVPVW